MEGAVLHVITSIKAGGAENHLLALAGSQARTGASVTVAYLKDSPELETEFAARGIKTSCLGLKHYGDPIPAMRLARLISRRAPAVIHAHMPPAELYVRAALLMRLDSKTPLVISRHNTERFFDGPMQLSIARFVARRANRVIAISRAVEEDTLARRLAAPSCIDVIPYGIDPKPFRGRNPHHRTELRHGWGFAPDDFVVGTIARLAPQKGLDVLLESFALAASRSKRRLKLAVVGEGPLRQALLVQARALGLDGSVLWLGRQPPAEVPPILAAFDLFALPSRYEGLGLVLLEALAAGTPIVASRVGPIPEIIRDGATGTLVSPDDPEALAQAIVAAAAGRAIQDVDAARLDLEARFSIEAMLSATLRCYDAATAART
jgi:glycosyltransferase involved in cell wall biosynthesis